MRAYALLLVPLVVCAALAATEAEAAQQLTPAQKQLLDRMAKLKPLTGEVSVGDKLATIALPDGYRYLTQADARFVVEQVWGNPPDASVLGLVLPAGASLVGDDSWAVIVSYSDEGHIDDSDAAKVDFDDLLADIQKDTRASNAERKKQGYPTSELVGWAEPPHYDREAKKLYWAMDLRFSGTQSDTLNYCVRILGRKGYLVLNAVSDTANLAKVAEGSKLVLAATTFASGNRYGDFNPSIDKIAAVGIGGLIAGKVLLKAGILKLLLKPLIFVGVFVSSVVAKMFGKKKAAA